MTSIAGSIAPTGSPSTGYFLDEWTVYTIWHVAGEEPQYGFQATPDAAGDFTINDPDFHDRDIEVVAKQPLGTSYETSVSVSVGDYRYPSAGISDFTLRCDTGGTTDSTEPNWGDPTHGDIITEPGGVKWQVINIRGAASNRGMPVQRIQGVAANVSATLLGGSVEGAIYDISDTSTLWKDTAGTSAVTADGDLVARVDDLSGNNYHLLQGTSASRPVYRTFGGYHWLEFDGSDDYLSVDTSTTFMDGGGFMGVAFSSFVTEGLGGVFEEAETANLGDRVIIYADTRATPNRHSLYYANSGTTEYVNFSEEQDVYPVVLTLNTDGTTGSGYKDGVLLGTAGASDSFTGNTSIYMGRQASSGTGTSFKGRIYRAVITDDEQSTENRELIERWLGEGMGKSI